MSSPDVIVVGAGVLGLCTAAELAARGRSVTVIDPGGPNASSIAAGMIAPAMESLLDGVDTKRAGLLRRARDLWPDFARDHALALIQDGAVWRGPDADEVAGRLRALGFAVEIRDGEVFTPDDWRIEPEPALARLTSVPGVALLQERAVGVGQDSGAWRVVVEKGEIAAPHLVLATGAAGPIDGLPHRVAAAIKAVVPIRGQITRVDAAASGVVRGEGGYVAPSLSGALAGATMEPGRRDLAPAPATARAQAEAASRLLGVDCAVVESRVGVRGATADGLPLAGPSGEPGLWLALAPRRNGWLMGPGVARIVADQIEGRPASPDAAALDPLRFG